PRGRAFYPNCRCGETGATGFFQTRPDQGCIDRLRRKCQASPMSQPAAARYLQVKQYILERISGGSLRTGERVPSENELVRELDVARMTANRALRELAADGVLVRVAGVGTFVAEQRVHAHPLEVRNIADEIRARGHEYEAKIIVLDSVSASREI